MKEGETMNEESNHNVNEGKLFTKGGKGGPGRKARPESIKKLADEAPDRLAEMAHDPKTNDKLRADIYKWSYEIVYGKAKQQVDTTVVGAVANGESLSVADKMALVRKAVEIANNEG